MRINRRSLAFRLMLGCMLLSAMMAVASGVYTYLGLNDYLERALQERLNRRASQISRVLAAQVSGTEESSLHQLDILYMPEANYRFIRITRQDGKLLYASWLRNAQNFDPGALAPAAFPPAEGVRTQPGENGASLYVTSMPVRTQSGGMLLVEVGSSDAEIRNVLHDLTRTLWIGFPGLLLLGSIGGYLLIQRSLKPVSGLIRSAEKISVSGANTRLPVPGSGDELEQLAHALNRMIGRLDEAAQQAIRFTADASHELRTPLSVMRGELESVIREPAGAEFLQERVGAVLKETERLSHITEGLMAVARLDAGEALMETVLFDLSDLVRGTAEQMLLLAEEKRISVTLDTGMLVTAGGDPARFKQVVVNLFDNAIKYTPEGGSITLRTRNEANQARLEVEDTGIGIPAEAIPHVFERFYRVDKMRSRELGGAGLGLSIVRAIVQAHGGRVEVKSMEGGGTCFIISLPCTIQPRAVACAAA